jgi:hypothetical protein
LKHRGIRIDLLIAPWFVGVVMEDFVPLDVLPVLPTPVVKMYRIALTRHHQLLLPRTRLY